MNILLWVLQILLALHTTMGAVWKFSNSERTVPSLKAIPHGVWLAMSVFDLLWSVALILPALNKPLAILAPIAAACIAAEMLLFLRGACLFRLRGVRPHDLLACRGCHMRVYCLRQVCAKAFLTGWVRDSGISVTSFEITGKRKP
jgi:hypothetical protein